MTFKKAVVGLDQHLMFYRSVSICSLAATVLSATSCTDPEVHAIALLLFRVSYS